MGEVNKIPATFLFSKLDFPCKEVVSIGTIIFRTDMQLPREEEEYLKNTFKGTFEKFQIPDDMNFYFILSNDYDKSFEGIGAVGGIKSVAEGLIEGNRTEINAEESFPLRLFGGQGMFGIMFNPKSYGGHENEKKLRASFAHELGHFETMYANPVAEFRDWRGDCGGFVNDLMVRYNLDQKVPRVVNYDLAEIYAYMSAAKNGFSSEILESAYLDNVREASENFKEAPSERIASLLIRLTVADPTIPLKLAGFMEKGDTGAQKIREELSNYLPGTIVTLYEQFRDRLVELGNGLITPNVLLLLMQYSDFGKEILKTEKVPVGVSIPTSAIFKGYGTILTKGEQKDKLRELKKKGINKIDGIKRKQIRDLISNGNIVILGKGDKYHLGWKVCKSS